MARFSFFVNGVIRAGDEKDAKYYLQELIADEGKHTTLPSGVNWDPVEFFEVNVSEIEEEEEVIEQR